MNFFVILSSFTLMQSTNKINKHCSMICPSVDTSLPGYCMNFACRLLNLILCFFTYFSPIISCCIQAEIVVHKNMRKLLQWWPNINWTQKFEKETFTLVDLQSSKATNLMLTITNKHSYFCCIPLLVHFDDEQILSNYCLTKNMLRYLYWNWVLNYPFPLLSPSYLTLIGAVELIFSHR